MTSTMPRIWHSTALGRLQDGTSQNLGCHKNQARTPTHHSALQLAPTMSSRGIRSCPARSLTSNSCLQWDRLPLARRFIVWHLLITLNVHTCTYIYIYIYVYIYIHTNLYVCKCTDICSTYKYVYLHTHGMHMIHILVCLRVYVGIYIYVCI